MSDKRRVELSTLIDVVDIVRPCYKSEFSIDISAKDKEGDVREAASAILKAPELVLALVEAIMIERDDLPTPPENPTIEETLEFIDSLKEEAKNV